MSLALRYRTGEDAGENLEAAILGSDTVQVVQGTIAHAVVRVVHAFDGLCFGDNGHHRPPPGYARRSFQSAASVPSFRPRVV